MNLTNYLFILENLPAELCIPDKIDFPFFYAPQSLAKTAALEVQKELETKNFSHDFGIDNKERNGAIGKMFGVLVVRNKKGQLGYLKAFSGKLGASNFQDGYVPPVFDILDEDGFFKKEEAILNQLNKNIEEIEKSKNYFFLKEENKEREIQYFKELSDFRFYLKSKKKERDEIRKKYSSILSENEFHELEENLKKESISQQIEYKKLNKTLTAKLALEREEVDKIESHLEALKKNRRQKSNDLQNKIFDHYTFLNQNKEQKSLLAIFKDSIFKTPPAGAGECAAPKLFQFAFLHDLQPICMAEFWWGMPPDSEVRVHKQFYPACRGKCEPILNHMLSASRVEASPLNTQSQLKEIEILYEDEWIVAVNKPHDFLSVPGKVLSDSILNRLKEKYPSATGPLLLHRIDMSTSGILLAAKTMEIHKILQKQFIDRKIQKTYHAILDGLIKQDMGLIDLPISMDVLDRPKQKVCYTEGKKATTKFKVLTRKNGRTLIEFYPITGRTHQLRIHSAHFSGLNCPILGDDLYGKRDQRLYLHAYQLKFFHPMEKKDIQLCAPSNFDNFM
jgi:tRNA pseudouridine32 synthase/23S rRNA pseudouridine746 synthase